MLGSGGAPSDRRGLENPPDQRCLSYADGTIDDC